MCKKGAGRAVLKLSRIKLFVFLSQARDHMAAGQAAQEWVTLTSAAKEGSGE